MFYSISDKKQIESLSLIADIKKTIKEGSNITAMQYDSGTLTYFVESKTNFVWVTINLPLDIAIKIESILS